MIHTVKGFGIVNETELNVFLEFSCFFYYPTDVGNFISGSSAFSKPRLYMWKFLVHVLLKPSLKDFEHYLASMWNEYNCAVVWTFFGIAFLWDWNENRPFAVLWPLLSFPNLLAYWVQHFNIFFQDLMIWTTVSSWSYGKLEVYLLSLWFYSLNKSSATICGACYHLESALTYLFLSDSHNNLRRMKI